MVMQERVRVGILGASGYTGADLVRLLLAHPRADIRLLTADRQAGQPIAAVYPHFFGYDLPDLVTVAEADWSTVDVVFCGLPHGTTQAIVAEVLDLAPAVKVVDLSADFRLRDPATYADWYGHEHRAVALQEEAVYGLTEHYRGRIKDARLVACPGCYPTAVLLAMLPLVTAGLIDPARLILDAKSGVSGAGRSLKQNLLFCEAGEGLSPYGVGHHRHMPEIEQELAAAGGGSPRVSFTPHLVPMSRGELITAYAEPLSGHSAQDLHTALSACYADEPFVQVLPFGKTPGTAQTRGSNRCLIGVAQDRRPDLAIVVSAIDNLVKGSSGQAIQNMNAMMGLPETEGLTQVALFP